MHTTVCSGKEIEPSSLRYGYFNHPCDTPSPNSWFDTSEIRTYPVDANSTNSLPQRSNIKKNTASLQDLEFCYFGPGTVGWEKLYSLFKENMFSNGDVHFEIW